MQSSNALKEHLEKSLRSDCRRIHMLIIIDQYLDFMRTHEGIEDKKLLFQV